MTMPFRPELPMRALILSAGRGSRLGPLTHNRPKCLLQFAGKPLLEWQIEALQDAGVADIVVVAGFRADAVADMIGDREGVSIAYNPFYQVADNLASLWMVREKMDRDFIVLNGDTLISSDIVTRLVERGRAPVNITVTRKADYDDDDMKVHLVEDRVAAVGKRLPKDQISAESIGILSFRGGGVVRFRRALETCIRTPEGLQNWYLSVIDRLAQDTLVAPLYVDGMASAEVDYPEDLEVAEAIATFWRDKETAPAQA